MSSPNLESHSSSTNYEERRVQLRSADGLSLGALLLCPVVETKVALVLHSGAGIRASSYGSFARFLAASGIAVLLYDYRGVGWSRPDSLVGFQAEVEDWSEYDAASANDFMLTTFPRAKVVGVTHSLGAMLLIGCPNASRLHSFVFIAPHTGYYGDYKPLYRLPMALAWHVAMPAITAVVGYFPGRALRLGEDLPRGIAMQWSARRRPNLLAGQRSQERAARLLQGAAELRRAALVITVDDDAFATPAGAERLLAWAPNLAVRPLQVSPGAVAGGAVGHFGFFRSKNGRELWPIFLARLLQLGVE